MPAQPPIPTPQVDSAQKNITLVTNNAAATIETAAEQVLQDQSALQAARSETLQTVVKQRDYVAEQTSVRQAQAQLDSARAGLMEDVVLQRQVDEARTGVRAAADQVDINRAEVRKAVIRCPISGTVIEMDAQQGETLVAGYTTAPIVTVLDMNRLQVNALVDETDIGKVKVGQPATVTVDAFADTPFNGRVVKIASGSTEEQNVVNYAVTVSIDDPLHELKPDMTATVEITVDTRKNVLAVPDEAIKPLDMGSVVGVVKPGASGPVERSVVTGGSDGTETEIVSGINEGDRVAISGWSPQTKDVNASTSD